MCRCWSRATRKGRVYDMYEMYEMYEDATRCTKTRCMMYERDEVAKIVGSTHFNNEQDFGHIH